MARVNLSVPDNVKLKMDQLEGLNWSAIATEAFQSEIRLQELKMTKPKSNEAGLERLRQSRAASKELREAEGVGLGKEWALEVAEHDELERVAALDVSELDDDSVPGALFAAMAGEDTVDRYTYEEQYEAIFGERKTTDAELAALCRGAVEGAAQILAEV